MRAEPTAPRTSFYARVGKRLFDLALTVPALVLLSPVYALLAIAVRLQLGAPLLFRQRRPGRLGRPFRMLKFRSMRELFDEHGRPLGDGDRLTRFGRMLRRSSLDELPELWNVLRGEMALVGPRPLRMRYLSRYSPEQSRRHQLRPGITGWAQVRGRNAVSWDEKLRLDVWYVDHLSFTLDLRILALTILEVVRGRGISASGCATMHEFMGSEHERPDRASDGS